MLAPIPNARLCANIASRADIARACLLEILEKTAAPPVCHPGALFFARLILGTLGPCTQASADRPGWFGHIFLWRRAEPSQLVQIQITFGISPRFPLARLRHVSFRSHPG